MAELGHLELFSRDIEAVSKAFQLIPRQYSRPITFSFYLEEVIHEESQDIWKAHGQIEHHLSFVSFDPTAAADN